MNPLPFVVSLASARLCRGEACLARRIDIENNRNTCAPHTAGEACLAPTIAPMARTLNLYLRLGCFFAPKGQQNSAQGNALGGTETHIFAPCKGSKIVFIALPPQGFVGARHASPANAVRIVSISLLRAMAYLTHKTRAAYFQIALRL